MIIQASTLDETHYLPFKIIYKQWSFNFTNLHPNLVKTGQVPVVLEKWFTYISSLKKARSFTFEQTRIPFTQECFVPGLVNLMVQKEKNF